MSSRHHVYQGYRTRTPSNTLDEQADLDELCAQRQLRTSEIFTPNAYYGADQILKSYAALPPHYRLKIAMPHGVELDGTDYSSFGRREPVPILTYNTEARRRFLDNRGARRLSPMASPYLYLLEMQKRITPATRSGTIFFPSHSAAGHRVLADFKTMAERLIELPRSEQPVSICLYFQDYLNGSGRHFSDLGMPVYSAGHPYDPLFLLRLHHLCVLHKYAMSSDFGSAPIYAMASGCTYSYLDFGEPEWEEELTGSVWRLPDAYREMSKKLAGISAILPSDQHQIALAYLGGRYLKSPPQLRNWLYRAELADWTDIRAHSRWGISVPTRWRRAIRGRFFQFRGLQEGQ